MAEPDKRALNGREECFSFLTQGWCLVFCSAVIDAIRRSGLFNLYVRCVFVLIGVHFMSDCVCFGRIEN